MISYVSQYIIIVQIIIFGPFGINKLSLNYFENRVLLNPVLGGGGGRMAGVAISVLVMNRLNTTESAIFIYFMYPMLPKDLTIQNLFISTAAGVVPYGGRKTSPCTSS